MATNPTQTLHQAIQAKFGLQGASDSPTLGGTSGSTPQTTPRFVIPQLKIPQLQLQAATADAAAQRESRLAADAHNQLLLNEIKLRRRQRSESENQSTTGSGFVIPQLAATTTTPGKPLNIPLLARLEHGVDRLRIRDDGGDGAKAGATITSTPAPLIDLSSTVIAASKDAPPKDTNNYVESSFWNFDALYQPQQHPARDAHDTFFVNNPAKSHKFPQDYLERVKKVHSQGGYGSKGYGYDWKLEEAQKNLLRTHTTAVSARMLYKLANQEGGFKPAKYFSIDKVFRNETLDATHLAEFHQVEGVIADVGLTLGDLIGTLYEFFRKLGITQLEFKPAYNPYTEPSMEIFCYHPGLGKWIEVGNSGVFRPEMLLPMGVPENVNVIAWGLSLERPTMIKYGINNIRDLVGPKVDLKMVEEGPICRLDHA